MSSNSEKWLSFYFETTQSLIEIGVQISIELFNRADFKKSDNFSGYLYLKNLIEILDSISVNISHGITTTPTKILNRSALEYFFGATYLFLDKTKYIQKCKDIAFISIMEERKGFEPFYEENIGKIARKLKQQYKIKERLDFSKMDYSENKSKYDNLINHPDFKEVIQEYNRTKNKEFFKKKNIIPWYSLWDGPNTIEILAHRTNTWKIYDSIYRDFSLYSHGHKIIDSNRIHKDIKGNLITYPIRTPYEMDFVTTPSIYICNFLFNKILDDYLIENSEIRIELLKVLKNYFKIKPNQEPFDPKSNSFIPFPKL